MLKHCLVFTVTPITHSLEHWMRQCITDYGDFMNPYCVVLVFYKVVVPDVSNETSDSITQTSYTFTKSYSKY